MRYNISDIDDNNLCTVESKYSVSTLRPLLKILFNVDDLDIRQIKEGDFLSRFYVHRYKNGDFRVVEYLGCVDTNRTISDIWDYVYQLFDNGSEGIFIRKEKVC